MAVNPADTVTITVGGANFVTRRATLYRFPNTRLYNQIAADELQKDAYYFDRDPEVFRFILDFYRTGELHLPTNICGPFVRKELIFWGIHEASIGPCCLPHYVRFDEEKRTKNTLFKDCFEDIEPMQSLVRCSRGFRRMRYRMWLFLDYPTSSLPAKLWAMLLLLLMICSVMCYCLQTHLAFRSPSSKVFWNNSTTGVCRDQLRSTNSKVRKDCETEPMPSLVIVDITLNAVFTFEFFTKLVVAPDKTKFLKSPISIMDIIILGSYWIYVSLFFFYYYRPDADELEQWAAAAEAGEPPGMSLWWLNVLSMSQALRILRVFKISKISRGLRVLMLTVKKSIPELVLLGFLLMNGMFLFSSMVYMAEYKQVDTFSDIPHAFWWSIVTLTTVGYGDIVPKGGPGFIVGSIAAVSGCIVTGLAIPIIGNNFNTYYKYMQNQMKENKYLKIMTKDLNSSLASQGGGRYGQGGNKRYIQQRSYDNKAATDDKILNGLIKKNRGAGGGGRQSPAPQPATPATSAAAAGASASATTTVTTALLEPHPPQQPPLPPIVTVTAPSGANNRSSLGSLLGAKKLSVDFSASTAAGVSRIVGDNDEDDEAQVPIINRTDENESDEEPDSDLEQEQFV